MLNFLWLLPLVAGLFWWAERRRRALIGRIVAPKLRALLAGNTSPARRLFRGACVVGALALLVVALAEPRLGYDTLEVPHRGRDVIIAMDVSRSMLATDVAPSRLQRAKLLAEDLISELGGDRIGLVAFAGSAFLQAPLTLDHGAVLSALDEMDTDIIPRGGTNLAAAIRTSEDAFTKAEGFSRAIIIISDGEELDADGVTAARDAAADGVRIFTVGVGSTEGSEIPLGPGEFVRDSSGKIVQSKLDAARMSEIAEVTGGFYTPLDDNAARLLAVDGVGKMAESDISVDSARRPIERYQWPLGAAIALLVLQALVGERRRVPVAAAVASVWLIGSTPVSASGLSAYEQGNYEEAQRQFEARLKMEPEAPELQLNAGAAAYRLKDYAKASQYFSKAMLADDPALRSAAEFNLGNTLFRQGEGQEDKDKKISDWKDAIAQYDAALKTRPDYAEAQDNKQRVEQLLEQLEKEQAQKQDKKDQQKKDQQQQQDQQKQEQQQQDQQEQDQEQQSGGEQEQKDQQSGGEKEQQEQQGGGEQDKKDQQQGGGQEDQKDQQSGGQQQKEPAGEGGKDKKEQGEQQSEDDKQGQGGQGDKEQEKKEGGEQSPEQRGEGEKNKEDQPRDPQEGKGGEKDQRQGDGGGEDQREGNQSPTRRPGESEGGKREQGDQPAPVPTPSGEKKQGELRDAEGGRGGEGGDREEAMSLAEAEAEANGQMSAAQARALLRSLQGEEESVDLLERRAFQDVTRDW